MAEFAALSVAASILQVIDISVRVAERLNEYRKKEDSLPTAFKHVSTRLPIFILALQNTNAKMEDMTDEARRALKPAIEECFSQIKKLETIINKVLFKPGDRGATRGWKSIKSVRYDSDVSDLEKVIRRYMEAMDYGLSSMALNSGTEKSSPQPISTCPFEREADFVERDIMSDVMTRCEPGSRSALIGIGGAGKSRIAIEYNYRIREAAPDTWVFWVTFDTPAGVAQGFRKIAKAVGLRGWDEKAVDIFTMVHDWLKDESNGPWTLVLDNVDSVDVLSAPASRVTSSIDNASPMPQIRDFITTSTKGSVLVTSRNAEAAQMITGNRAYHIEVDEMNESEAIALLKKKLSIKVIYTEAEAAELVKSVDFMPLAISQIAKNINMDYPRLTLSKATERIKALSEETAQLLEKRDHHSAEDLSRAALAALEVVKGPHCEDTLCSYHQLGLAIGVLNRHNESEKMFRRAYEGRQALLGFDHSDTLESANQLGAQLIMQKKYEEGEAMHMRTIEGYERVYGPRSAKTTILLAILTFTYMAHERFEQATVMHRKVLTIQKRDDGEEADDAYEGLRCLGILLIRQGKAAEAETIHRQVVEDTTRRLGLYHSETITSVSFLCEALVKQRKLDEAVAQYRSVTDIYTDLDNKEAQQKALLAMNGLAETLVQQGHFEQAEAVCRRFVLESERLLGADHCDILIGVRTLADTLTKQERYQEALVLYERAYIGIEKCCGADSPDTKLFLDDFNNAKRNI
ncbi:hypothetical protein ACET3X_000968 [Alternaria dauci]|uniref:NACHT-NTPase and P-loop NTPases N-terminal domain-containing protein n=1 Tax=Alternaria dauci TaxID=48095 RepID=A0ABR3UVY4_9PLEO